MTLNAHSYGSVAGVASYVRHTVNAASYTFDPTTEPTLSDVERFLDECSAQLNGWLAAAGYTIPVTNTDATLILDRFANMGAAGNVELTLRSAGYSDEDENKREIKFLSEFAKAEKYINSGALGSLGAGQTTDSGPLGLRIGGSTSTRAALTPIFRRTSFGNVPSAEGGEDE